MALQGTDGTARQQMAQTGSDAASRPAWHYRQWMAQPGSAWHYQKTDGITRQQIPLAGGNSTARQQWHYQAADGTAGRVMALPASSSSAV